jgi:YfiH family protein
MRNRQRVAASLPVRAQNVVFAAQEHTDKVLIVDEHTTIPPPCDALVTTTPNVLLGIYTADCVPVLLYGETVVGVAHCGWKGLKAELIPKTLDVMRSLGARNFVAAIGPCIRMKSYAVEEAFLENVAKYAPCICNVAGAWHVDLPKIAKVQLNGVQNIEELCVDTYEEVDTFFSCRRFLQADPNARIRTQASVICLRPK